MPSEPSPQAPPVAVQAPVSAQEAQCAAVGEFDQIYADHFAFVWRTLRRMGVADATLDDAAQEVFLVIHRRLGDLQLRSSLRSWIFGIVSRVAKDCRRLARRKDPRTRSGEEGPDVDSLVDEVAGDPEQSAEQADAVRILHGLLEQLDWQKREAFVLVELEQMSVPEAADALGVNVNTVYSRVRAARQGFNQAVSRHLARDQRRGT